ncbi:MAG: carboxypeptidase regulatory-like domain-containing protein, partial [Bacteroidales bacterium]|nr:carboxypeptidase regulatory-like domain-containing protein [Bacteroidales bacterium]
MKKILFGLLFISFIISAFADNGWRENEKEVKVLLKSTSDFEKLNSLKLNGDIAADHAIVYVIPSELDKIQKLGLEYRIQIENMNQHYQYFWQTDEAYHSYDEIIELADSLAEHFPGICEKHIFGTSIQGRQCAALKISDNVGVAENEAEVMFDGGIHGDEIGASENVIRFARHLCLSYETDATITELINNREIWLYLMVNPDGRANMARTNANGVDLNRDWGYMWDAWGGSSGAYSQPESKALRGCAYSNQFVVHTTYHSGTEYISCPWSYRPDHCPDYDHIIQLAGTYSSTSGYANMEYGQGCTGMYPINGSTKDGNYGALGAISWSMEISYDKQPPASQLMSYYLKNVPAMLAMIEYAGFGLEGIVTDAITGEPVVAAVFVDDYFPTYSDHEAGDYHKYVLPGTYSITVKANGYQTQTINNIVVTSNNSTATNFELTPQEGQYIYKISSCQIPDNNHDDEGNTPGIIGAPDN